ncbi:hypothetical protein ACST8Y_18050, partial [Klebsiella pneumoniae]|uniref:hypothetical protein n=1 Tax=Klebsiella pneumoniae TaxID=573 RepID=UPI003FA07967
RITPSVAEQEGQQTETEATGAPQKHHYTLNQQVGSITRLAGYHGGADVISQNAKLTRVCYGIGIEMGYFERNENDYYRSGNYHRQSGTLSFSA